MHLKSLGLISLKIFITMGPKTHLTGSNRLTGFGRLLFVSKECTIRNLLKSAESIIRQYTSPEPTQSKSPELGRSISIGRILFHTKFFVVCDFVV